MRLSLSFCFLSLSLSSSLPAPKGGKSGEYEELRERPYTKILGNGTLLLQHVKEDREGFYLCQASNGIGTGIGKVVELKVNCKLSLDPPSLGKSRAKLSLLSLALFSLYILCEEKLVCTSTRVCLFARTCIASPFFAASSRLVTVKKSDTATLHCEVNGDKPISVSWFKGGKDEMNPSTNYRWVDVVIACE